MSLLSSLPTVLSMQLEHCTQEMVHSGRPKPVLTFCPPSGRRLANEQEMQAMVHTFHGSQQRTACPRNFPSVEKATVFPRANKKNTIIGVESQFLLPRHHTISFPVRAWHKPCRWAVLLTVMRTAASEGLREKHTFPHSGLL